MTDYGGELDFCKQVGDEAGFSEARQSVRTRALTFLQRGLESASVERTTRKRRRMKSMLWGLALDNCLQFTTGKGLEAFELTDSVRALNPCDWPRLDVVPDQGSDGNCFTNAARWGWEGRKYMIDVSWDKSYGGHNDVK